MMSSFVLRVTTKAHFLIIAAVVVSLPADNPQDPASKKDLDGLQGSWKLVPGYQTSAVELLSAPPAKWPRNALQAVRNARLGSE